MIEEAYKIFASWDLALSKRVNLDRLRETNDIGATSDALLRFVAKVFNRRFDPTGPDRALLVLAKAGYPIERWRAVLLWHITRDEFLFRDFLINWLYPEWLSGTYRLTTDAIREHLKTLAQRGGVTEHAWTERTIERVVAGLLRMAVDFGLLKGSLRKEFASYHMPDEVFLYVLHTMREDQVNAGKIIPNPDWRIFLMQPADVERELLRLHQFRRLSYEVAGSLVQLSLPCSTSCEYVEQMVA